MGNAQQNKFNSTHKQKSENTDSMKEDSRPSGNFSENSEDVCAAKICNTPAGNRKFFILLKLLKSLLGSLSLHFVLSNSYFPISVISDVNSKLIFQREEFGLSNHLK